MRSLLASLLQAMGLFGIDPRKGLRALVTLPGYLRDYLALRRQQPLATAEFSFGRPYPCLGEKSENSGASKGHYFHQDLLVASRIFALRPDRHFDVGSRIDGFVAHVASFRSIYVIDIRPGAGPVHNVQFIQADLMKEMPAELRECCDSLSCLHALEHFGLGRYGDPIRWDGYRVGFDNLCMMLKGGGRLYLSVPIGRQRIEFNAHRVFSIAHMLEMFSGKVRLERFSYVDDHGDLHEDVGLDEAGIRRNCECSYGCGIFELTKLS